MSAEGTTPIDISALPEDWTVEEYADGELLAEFEGSCRIEERSRWLTGAGA